MKVAVTGSSGYLGQLVLRSLDADPAVESILGLDIFPSRFDSPKLTHQFADVRTADLRRYCTGYDAVMHLAFVVSPPKNKSMADIEAINVGGSRRVFEESLEAGVSRIVYASSIAAYGAHWDNPAVLTEEHALRPNDWWYYSRTKGHTERMLDDIQRHHPDAIIVRLRPSIFLGPTTDNIMGRMFAAPVMLMVAGDRIVDLAWDEDIAEAFRLALYYPESDSFNLSGENPETMNDYADRVGKRVVPFPMPVFLAIAHLARASRLLSQGHFDWARAIAAGPVVVSARRARERLGWKPRLDAVGTLMEFAESWGLLR